MKLQAEIVFPVIANLTNITWISAELSPVHSERSYTGGTQVPLHSAHFSGRGGGEDLRCGQSLGWPEGALSGTPLSNWGLQSVSLKSAFNRSCETEISYCDLFPCEPECHISFIRKWLDWWIVVIYNIRNFVSRWSGC